MNSKTSLFGIRNTLDLTKAAVVAALYVVLTTTVFAAFSFGPLQFRFAEGLNNLVVFNKRYITAITLGCFISNMVSPMGPIDMIVGTFETFIALVTINLVTKHMKNIVAKLGVSVLIGTFYMFIIAIEIAALGNTAAFWPTFWSAYLTTGISEFVTMSIGAIVFYLINLKFDLFA